jgi:glycolate oxidase FAD binding subunit
MSREQLLRQAIGADAVLDPAAARVMTVHGHAPASLVMPTSADAMAAALALCSEEGWPVEPAGAGTWLRAGRPPGTPPVVISTARLSGVHEYEPADLTVGVEAGTPLADIAAALAEHDQWLPLDPPHAAGATIGATASLAAAGPLRHAFGTPRDAVLGLDLATGDGRLLRVGGRVVKNVAGYDMTRLVVGSHGMLGVITRMFLRLRPLAAIDETWRVAASEPDFTLIDELDRTLAPAALEWFDGALHIRTQGNVDYADWVATRMTTLGAQRLVPDEAARTWHDLARDEATATFAARCVGLPDRLPTLLAAARTIAAGLVPHGARIAAHAADGIVRVFARVPAPPRAADDDTSDDTSTAHARALADALARARAAAADAGCTIVCDVLPHDMPDVERYPAPGEERALLEGVRRHFDPAGVLAPGRWDA